MTLATLLFAQNEPPFLLCIPADIEEKRTLFLQSPDGFGGGEHFHGVDWSLMFVFISHFAFAKLLPWLLLGN
jgi:hypothetical protein